MGAEGIDLVKTSMIRHANFTIKFDSNVDLSRWTKDLKKIDDLEFEFQLLEMNSTGFIRIGFSRPMIVAANWELPDDRFIRLDLLL